MKKLSVLVLGAGELGMSILRGLAERAHTTDFNLSVLLRPGSLDSDEPMKQRQVAKLRSLGIEILEADLLTSSASDLIEIVAKFHTVVGCMGFVAAGSNQKRLAEIVLAASVQRYIPWQFGVNYDVIGRGSAQELFDEQLDVRNLLRSQDKTKWLIISTGMFTSFLFDPLFGVVDLNSNTVHALGSWTNSVTVTSPEDIGRLAAAILLFEPSIVNEVVYTAGDTVTYSQLAEIVASVTGSQVVRDLWTVETLNSSLELRPDDAILKYRIVFAEGKGVAWRKENTFNVLHGLEVSGIERWLKQRRAALAASGHGS